MKKEFDLEDLQKFTKEQLAFTVVCMQEMGVGVNEICSFTELVCNGKNEIDLNYLNSVKREIMQTIAIADLLTPKK
ncbi:MAG: hypothetical protein ABI241_00665 [Bacteroidia bacterium]